MTREHIDIYEVGNYPALCEQLDVDPSLENLDNGDNDVAEQMQDYWYDCDHVKLHGEEGRGNHMFITCDVDDTKFIIHRDDDDDGEATKLIDWFLDGAEGDLIGNAGSDGELKNTWYDWDKVQTGVAYRGGSGYCYGLYAKELITA